MLKLLNRVFAAAAVVLAASVPSVAYARLNLDPGPPVSTQQQRLDQRQRVEQLQQLAVERSASGGRWPASVSSASPTAPSHDGFQWSDAGIGAGGILILLSGGIVASAAVRRRRSSGPTIG